MHRIAAALLIVSVTLALNGGLLHEAMAKEPAVKLPVPSIEIVRPESPRSTKLLSLLMVLESLRQAPVSLEAQKV